MFKFIIFKILRGSVCLYMGEKFGLFYIYIKQVDEEYPKSIYFANSFNNQFFYFQEKMIKLNYISFIFEPFLSLVI